MEKNNLREFIKNKASDESTVSDKEFYDMYISCGIIFKGYVRLFQRVLEFITENDGAIVYQRQAPSFGRLWIFDRDKWDAENND